MKTTRDTEKLPYVGCDEVDVRDCKADTLESGCRKFSRRFRSFT